MENTVLSPEFLAFLKCLNDENVDYLLIGGYAVNIHGYTRATVDMDIWIAVSPTNAEKLIRAFDRYGFDVDGMSEAIFMKPRSIVRFGEAPMKIEVVTTIGGVEYAACRSNAIEVNVSGLTVPVIGLRDLRTNKAASSRPKDLVDLEHLPEA